MAEDNKAKAIKEGIARSRMVRTRWIDAIVDNKAPLRKVIEYTKRDKDNRDAKYVAGIKLWEILEAREGWTKASAIEVLIRNGFNEKTTLQSIRNTEKKIDLFETMLNTTVHRWRGRPKPPHGWPWQGKLKAILEESDNKAPEGLG